MNVKSVKLSLIDEGDAGFGIIVRSPVGECRVIHSVCLGRQDAEYICNTVNRLGVSECHVYDVIEDLLP